MAPRREKKPTKSSFGDDDLKRKKTSFKQIFPNFKKKSTELPDLCDNSLAFICYGPDNNDLHVWPDPQENPQAVPEILAKFKAMSDQKRKKHACDLYDFPNLPKPKSRDEMMMHISMIKSHLLGVRQQRIALLRKKTLKGSSDADQKWRPSLKETLEEDKDLTVSANATVSNRQASSSEDLLGFGGAFDELGYVVCGSQETVSNLRSFAASTVSTDAGVPDCSRVDPFTLGFYDGCHYLPADPTPVTYYSGVCANDGVWDPFWIDLECPSTLFADDWAASSYDPLLEFTDSLGTDNLEGMF